ncbi:sensor histidine kinase [Spirosoma sp.]|uniref:sensor histidine kinase n=1 Tax=Spirosoma sp. TaxID=1899569 RepID=UPI003B3A850E
MENTPTSESPLATIAAYLFTKREITLNSWFTRVCNDPASITAVNLTREEFNDQVPAILEILDQRLRQQPDQANPQLMAREHGVHRWHKGYGLTELLLELGHLHTILAHELELYSTVYTNTEVAVLSRAHRLVSELMHEVIQGSAAQYNELQRQEATQRATNLQQALQSLGELTRQRGELLRSASHDLRSYFSLMRGAAWLLDQPGTADEQKQWRGMWQRNLDSAATLLTRLMDLARLEAGQESLHLESFDAGVLLRQIAETIRPVAKQRQITFDWAGPESLPTEGDSIKVQRIILNLLANALAHTHKGWITLSWSREDNFRWIVSIQDSGPGLSPDLVGQLAQSLTPTVDSASVLQVTPSDDALQLPEETISANYDHPKGEGIGLSIVKRLCELLRANIDIETRPGAGTLFRVRFPMHYKSD